MLSTRHETDFSLAAETQRLLDRTAAAHRCRQTVPKRFVAVRRGSGIGCQSSGRQSLACPLESRRQDCAGRRGANRPQVSTLRERSVPLGSDPFGRSAGPRLRDRSVDLETYRPGHSARILGYVSHGACLENPRATGVELPAPRTEGSRTQRRRHPTLVALSLAADQKKARETKALLIFLDESGFSERPSVRRTWSPRGQTPILIAPFNWKRLSAIASLVTTPAARRVGLCLRLQPGTVKQPQVLAYLKALKRHVRGRKVILLWDRLPAHRGKQVQAWIAKQPWLTFEYLPPYAPELNPVEYFWSHLSRTDMAQFVGEDLGAVRRQARKGACRVRSRPDLGKAFLKHSGLF
jgi:hypothetical protein